MRWPVALGDMKQVAARRVVAWALVLLSSLTVTSLAQQAGPPIPTVGTVAAERKPISKTLDFVGRIEAINRVEVRARVHGYLDAVLFKEGETLKEGDLLYRIEQGPFQAAVKEAEGALLRAKAMQLLAQQQRARAEELYSKGSGTAVARDQALAADEQAKGQIKSADAARDTAKFNLGYTEIAAPITGKVSRTNATIGNVVGPDSGVLTLIVSQDPMYVTFPVSQREFLRAQQAGHEVGVDKIKVQIRYADGTLYDQVGTINFIDVTVDRATDTVLVRGTIPNPSGGIIDGQLVRVVLESGTPADKVVIPQSALIADQEGTYVFVVEDGKAVIKRIKVASGSGADAVIEQGLSGGEQVITEGFQGVRPGAQVNATPVPAAAGRS
jgi:membrane fusion protein (multidrug efflux system)